MIERIKSVPHIANVFLINGLLIITMTLCHMLFPNDYGIIFFLIVPSCLCLLSMIINDEASALDFITLSIYTAASLAYIFIAVVLFISHRAYDFAELKLLNHVLFFSVKAISFIVTLISLKITIDKINEKVTEQNDINMKLMLVDSHDYLSKILPRIEGRQHDQSF